MKMKRLLNDLDMRGKLLLVLAVPIAGMVVLSAVVVYMEWSIVEEKARLSEVSRIGETVSGLLHASQSERAVSAGYLASGGTRMERDLRAARDRTDSAVRDMLDVIEDVDLADLPQSLRNDLALAEEEFERLDAVRQDIDSLAVTRTDAIGFFNDLDVLLLAALNHGVGVTSDAELQNQLMALVKLAEAKEQAGKERVALHSAFSDGGFDDGEYRRILASVAAQASYFDAFEMLADDEILTAYNERMTSDTVQEAERLRESALTRGEEAELDMDAGEWFAAQSAKMDTLREVESLIIEKLLTSADAVRSRSLATLWAVVLAVLLGLGLAVGLAWMVTRALSRQVEEAVVVSEALAEGDLSREIHVEGRDEIGRLMESMKQMVTKLRGIVGDVNAASDALASASEEVSATAQNVSQGASEQAASVEQTTSSVEQMSASIEQNNENARVTNEMSTRAAREAQEGGEAVGKTVEAMKEIAEKISIIDEIAYQTNLLALNAAIEAARAGEHGKGFAVVAAEVRKLAERSQVAAQEIGEVAQGSVALAEQAGSLLEAMVPSIEKTAELVQEISAASSEQASGASQINQAMEQLNAITQQSASSSEQLASTSEEMSGQAQQLQQLMTFFTLAGAAAAERPRPPRSEVRAQVHAGKDEAAADRATGPVRTDREAAAAAAAMMEDSDAEFVRF
jgi:methyl-accepting chemotaxis protein